MRLCALPLNFESTFFWMAIDGCVASASDHLRTTVKVKSLTIETEKDIASHLEVSSVQTFDGLNCGKLKEEIVEIDSAYKVWV